MVSVHTGQLRHPIVTATTTGIIQVILTGVDVAATIHMATTTTHTIPHTMEAEVVAEAITVVAEAITVVEAIIQDMGITMEDMMITITAQELQATLVLHQEAR